jgi:hypothetical protein
MKLTRVVLCLLLAGFALADVEEDATKDVKAVRGVFEVSRPHGVCTQSTAEQNRPDPSD